MEDYLNKFRELLKASLHKNARLENSSASPSLSIIADYSPQELFDEFSFLIKSLLSFKRSHKNASFLSTKKLNKENLHIHLTDLPSFDNSVMHNNDLKRKLTEIQGKYVSKIAKLLHIDPIRITTLPFGAISPKHHTRKSSAFSSVNNRHPGVNRNTGQLNRELRQILTMKSANIPIVVKKKSKCCKQISFLE
jgi:hypothetical protein